MWAADYLEQVRNCSHHLVLQASGLPCLRSKTLGPSGSHMPRSESSQIGTEAELRGGCQAGQVDFWQYFACRNKSETRGSCVESKLNIWALRTSEHADYSLSGSLQAVAES